MRRNTELNCTINPREPGAANNRPGSFQITYVLRSTTGRPIIRFETEASAKAYQLHHAQRAGVKLQVYRIKTIEEQVA